MANPGISIGGGDSVTRAIEVYQEAFREDPVITYMLCNLSPESKRDYLRSYFDVLLTAANLNGATFHQANDWSSCSVLMSPGQRVDNPWTFLPAGIIGLLWKLGLGGYQRMILEYGPKADAVKAKGLKGATSYYYIFFVGTIDKVQGQGLGSALVRELQDIARKDDLPVWLEATTEGSRKLYERLGFAIVEQITLGEGKAAADGTLEKGGEGVPIWGMVWWPNQPPK